MRTLNLCRFVIGRLLIHAGLRIMPKGRSRSELLVLLWGWGQHVKANTARREAQEG